MPQYTTNQFKSGLKLMLDGDPCSIVEHEFVKPGKGQAFSRVKLRNLKTGRVLERTFKSGASLPGADVVEVEMEFLYEDRAHWYFMNPSDYEQHVADSHAMGDAGQWCKAQDRCVLTLWNDQPLSVLPPNFVELTVTQTDPGCKGDTATGGNKPALLETGAQVRVPLFVEEGDVLRIDTRTGDYVARVKKSYP